MNCNINSSSVRTELLLGLLPSSYKILQKYASHSYVHDSGSHPEINHCIVPSSLICGEVHVHQDERDYYHLPLSLIVTLNATAEKSLRPNSIKSISKREWKKADWSLNFLRLLAFHQRLKSLLICCVQALDLHKPEFSSIFIIATLCRT